MYRHATAFVIALAFASTAQAPPAQTPPATDVYLASLRSTFSRRAEARPEHSNSPGYDNQPSFLAAGKSVLFASNRDGKQTDIYRYDIASKALTQLTHTAESEYSPLLTPDGKTFSVVRVEADGSQRLWRFDLDGANPRLVLENVKPVGYHVWIDATHLGLFILGAQGQPSTLQVADTASGTAEVVASNIGRCLLMRQDRTTVTFLSKASTPWMIKEFNPSTKTVTDLMPAITGPLATQTISEDFAWDPGGPSASLQRPTFFHDGSGWSPAGISRASMGSRASRSPQAGWPTAPRAGRRAERSLRPTSTLEP